MPIPLEVVVCCVIPLIVIAIFVLMGGGHLQKVWST
jgi:hypothetical protein